MKTTVVLAALVAVAGSAAASNEVITSWINFGQGGNQASSAVGTQAANVVGNVLTRGSGLTASAASNSLSASNWQFSDANDYFTFGFTVDAGYSVDLGSLWLGSRSSNTGPGLMGLFYSGDGFASSLHTFDQSPGSNFVNSIIDLSGLTGLTGTVEFRIAMLADVAANGGTVSSSGTFRVGDHFDGSNFTEMRFVGKVVPAPASLALLGLGGLVAGRRRR
jgi:hypothetical protein